MKLLIIMSWKKSVRNVFSFNSCTDKRISEGDMGAGESRQGTRADESNQDPDAEEEIARRHSTRLEAG
jgi:hypothetical protein